jgi:hypothetical protein
MCGDAVDDAEVGRLRAAPQARINLVGRYAEEAGRGRAVKISARGERLDETLVARQV